MALTGKQRRALRAMGHHLKVVVHVGQAGVTEAVVAATVQALLDHELVKVKVAEDDRLKRAEAAEKLATDTGAQLAQLLGRTALLFKAREQDPKIVL